MTESFEGLIQFALENGAGTLIPYNMLLYVAHLPGVSVTSGVFSKVAAQMCEDTRRLANVLPAFIPAVTAAMTREDAVVMGDRLLVGKWQWANPYTIFSSAAAVLNT